MTNNNHIKAEASCTPTVSTPGRVLFHGSTQPGIKLFNIGSHFGTRDQAVFAILAKGIRDNHQNLPFTPTIYECHYPASEQQIFKVTKDWGTPRPTGALLYYLRDLKLEELRRKLWNEHHIGKPENDQKALGFLLEEMGKRGHTALSYPNLVEGTGDSISIFDINRIHIESEYEVTKKELEFHFNANFKKLTRICDENNETLQRWRHFINS